MTTTIVNNGIENAGTTATPTIDPTAAMFMAEFIRFRQRFSPYSGENIIHTSSKTENKSS